MTGIIRTEPAGTTYRAVLVSPRLWVVKRFVDGAPAGLVATGFTTEAEALFAVHNLTAAENRA